MGSQDDRSARAAARPRQFLALVLVVSTVGVLLLGLCLLHLRVDRSALEPGFWMVCAILLLTEVRPLFTSGTRDANGLTVSTAFVFAILLRYGLPPAIVLQAAGSLLADLGKRRAAWCGWYNLGQYAISWAAAGAVLHLAGHSPTLDRPLDLTSADLLPAAAAAVTYFVLNELLVGAALTLHDGGDLRSALRVDAGYEVFTTGALLALSPLVCLAVERGAAFVPLLRAPEMLWCLVGSVALVREQQALSDALTGLPNRTLLRQRAADGLRAGPVALLLFDLDRFKEVNDTLGHHVGDRLLQVVADRLTLAVRPCDTVARLGGDEFALVLPGLADPEDARSTADRLRQCLCEPIVLEGLLVDVGASVGVAVSPEHGDDVDALLQHADVAMYLSKESGAVEVYDPFRDRNTARRLSVLGELRRALDSDELELHYQPAVSLRDDSVVGVEALVRWRHPERGLLPPDEFVPLAERGGLVQALTAWVLDTALRQQAAWQELGLTFRLAVNVTVRDLCGHALADEVEAGLRRYDVDASCLQLEVTESSLLADPVRAAGTLGRLAALGVELSLDDFGTGYSSLSHLRRLPVREIKIDRSFVSDIGDPRDLAVLRSVIDLGRGLGMTVVAEGVEDALTYHRLATLGCDVAQGWYISRAVPADALTRWVQARPRRQLQPEQPVT